MNERFDGGRVAWARHVHHANQGVAFASDDAAVSGDEGFVRHVGQILRCRATDALHRLAIQVHLFNGGIGIEAEVENHHSAGAVAGVGPLFLNRLEETAGNPLDHFLRFSVGALVGHHCGHVFRRHLRLVALGEVVAAVVRGFCANDRDADCVPDVFFAEETADVSEGSRTGVGSFRPTTSAPGARRIVALETFLNDGVDSLAHAVGRVNHSGHGDPSAYEDDDDGRDHNLGCRAHSFGRDR